MKIANWIIAVLFLAGAVVQYNDPDALPWIIIYGIASVFAGMAAMNKLPVKLASFFTVGCFFFFAYLVYRELSTGQLTWHDGMFEVLGVLILAIWTNVNIYFAKLRAQTSTE